MRVVIIGKQNHLHWVENVRDGFQKLNYKTKTIFTNNISRLVTLNKNLLKVISKNKANSYLVDSIENELTQFNPDLIIVISPFLLPKEISILLKSYNKSLKIAWVGDKFTDDVSLIASNYDKIYFTDSYFIDEFKKISNIYADYLPLAFNRNIFNNTNKINSIEDKLLFVGSLTDKRIKLLNSLENNIKLKVIGKTKLYKKLNKSIELLNKNISINDVAYEYSKSKFVLNIKHDTNVVNGLNMRTFEAIACGACLVQDYLKDLELNFDIKNEMLVYENIEEANELIKRYSRDEYELNRIISNGIKNIYSNHNYTNRIKKILSEI